jgi:hypothetical protein
MAITRLWVCSVSRTKWYGDVCRNSKEGSNNYAVAAEVTGSLSFTLSKTLGMIFK